MKLFIGNRLLNMSREELDKLYLQEGTEGVLYLVGDKVIKLYKDTPLISKLSVQEIERLRKIKTQRFVLPKEVVLTDEKKLAGYTTTFIDKSPFGEIFNLKGKDFKREIKILLEDIKELSNNGVEIDDMHLDNILLSENKIYFVDPGSFIIGDFDEKETYKINRFRLSNFIVNDLMAARIPKKYRKKLDKIFSSYDSLESFLENMDDEETVKNFSNRIVK